MQQMEISDYINEPPRREQKHGEGTYQTGNNINHNTVQLYLRERPHYLGGLVTGIMITQLRYNLINISLK